MLVNEIGSKIIRRQILSSSLGTQNLSANDLISLQNHTQLGN